MGYVSFFFRRISFQATLVVLYVSCEFSGSRRTGIKCSWVILGLQTLFCSSHYQTGFHLFSVLMWKDIY